MVHRLREWKFSYTLPSLGTFSISDLSFLWHSITLPENVADNLSSDVRQANADSIFPVEGIRQRITFSWGACVPKKTKGKMKGSGWRMFGYNRLPIRRRLFLSRSSRVFLDKSTTNPRRTDARSFWQSILFGPHKYLLLKKDKKGVKGKCISR